MIPDPGTIVESAEYPKNPAGYSEDRLLVADGVIAIVDGATDKSGRDYGGATGGSRAADTVAEALTMIGHAEPAAVLATITAHLARQRAEWGVATDDLLAPSAVAAVLNPARGVVWRVGDVHIGIRRAGNWETHPADKQIDRVVAAARAALLRCRLAAGATVEELLAQDVGRKTVMPILKEQNVLANTDADDPLGFGVLDGREVPLRYLEVFDLGKDVEEVVLASDGYLSPAATLTDAETELAADLAADPLRIGVHASTKAPPPGTASFDDRTYIRWRP